MAAMVLTSSMYRVVPMAPVESDGSELLSRRPAQLRGMAGAGRAGAGAGDTCPATRAMADADSTDDPPNFITII